MQRELVETDVLCVGGGIVGLMAAIRASELGSKVVVAEKSNTLRSGAAATGNDHFLCYIPEIHGTDLTGLMESVMGSQVRERFRFLGKGMARTFFERSFEIVKLWDSWGIPMKYGGKYEFAGHTFPGHPFIRLKYSGKDQKPILTKEAAKRGVQIINRVMVFELLRDNNGSIAGALGLSTREEKLVEFRAKSVILGTGTVTRLYPGLSPGWMGNLSRPGTVTGDGRAMAYRSGAELGDLEMPGHHAGPKYFCRSGQGTWVGVLRDPQGNPVGPFLTEPDRKYSDIIIEVNKRLFLDYAKSGKGPVYMDCTGISDQDHDYMMHWLEHEGCSAFVNHLREEGIDLRKNPVEFTTYGYRSGGGRIWQNERCETSVKGLYATGDETVGGISPAAIFGWMAGENAAHHAKDVLPSMMVEATAKIEEWERLFSEIRSREVGPDWKEVNIALQQIMNDYAGVIRSETLLAAGITLLQRLKKKAYATMIAKNQHELIRCLEVLNLLDLGELMFISMRERKETRGQHVRSDYPFTNPLLNMWLVIKKAEGNPVTEWREFRR